MSVCDSKKKNYSKKVLSESSFLKNIGKTIGHDLKEQFSLNNFNSHGFYIKDYNKKYSKSLNDLNAGFLVDNEYTSNGSDVFKGCKKSKSSIDAVSLSNDTSKFAKTCIANLIFLNAWRRQKNNFKQTQEKVNCLNEKLDGFEMQVYLLRQLLNAEKSRVEAANENIQNLIQKVQQHDVLEKNYHDLMEYNSQLEFELKNQENDILTAKFKAEDWEKQLQKEREKLKKILTEENLLKDQLKEKDEIVNDKKQTIKELQDLNQELQLKLSFQVPLLEETMAQVNSLKEKLEKSELLKEEFKKIIEEKEKEIKQLQLSIKNLEIKLQEKDERNGVLGKTILEKTNELNLIQGKIIELSKNKYSWNGGIIKVASLCAKIPVACICTVGSLLLPFPSYRL